MDLTRSYEDVLTPAVTSRYTWLEVRNAAAAIAASDRDALADLEAVLTRFHVTVRHLLNAGGGKSQLAKDLDEGVVITRSFVEIYHVAHWLAHHLGRINVDKNGNEMARLGTTTTTNMEKLKPRLQRGDAGGCPVLGVGIAYATYPAGVPYDLGDGRQCSPDVPAPTTDVAADLVEALVTDPPDPTTDSDPVARPTTAARHRRRLQDRPRRSALAVHQQNRQGRAGAPPP